MTSNKEANQIESLRRGLHLILETDGLPPRVEKIVRRMLSLIQDETKIPNYIAESIAKMIESRVQTPEQAAVKLTRKVRESHGKRRPPLGRPAGHGTRSPEKDEDDPNLREVAGQLGDRIRKAAERRRRPGGR
ncbi:MAG: hypothetical protein V3U52_05280 [Thermoplasmata archaeon]